MKRLIFFMGISLIIFACEKKEFVHTDEYMYPSCSCCEYADALAGSYTGWYLNRSVGLGPGGVFVDDTLVNEITTLHVSHVYTGQDFISDSMICALFIDGFVNDTIYIQDGTGKFIPALYDAQYFNPGAGSLFFNQYKFVYQWPYGTQHLTLSFDGSK